MAYSVVIDRTKCESNGSCFKVAAELIQPGSDGSPVVVRALFGGAQEAAARAAVMACPMAALRVDEIADP
jgi:ferredoxin